MITSMHIKPFMLQGYLILAYKLMRERNYVLSVKCASIFFVTSWLTCPLRPGWRVWFVGFVANDLIHKGNVRDGQTEGFDPRQTFLIGERWHFASQLVKRFVQVEHATSLADVGRTTLRHGRHSFPFLCRRRRRWQTATSGRVISIHA